MTAGSNSSAGIAGDEHRSNIFNDDYGDPLLREPERVREDVLSQFISFERARDVYGVMFAGTELSDGLAVDEAGTARMREVLRVGR